MGLIIAGRSFETLGVKRQQSSDGNSHDTSHTTYVAERNPEPDGSSGPIRDHLAEQFFMRFENGRDIRESQ